MRGDKYPKTSLWRVYNGKGAPVEIQEVLWLALLAGQVNGNNIATYADTNLGIDCGGFVANYWGIGCPTPTNPKPDYATGIKPAQQGADGKHDSKTGSQAFHIGVVASVQPIAGTDLVDLDIAESSGARASSGGTGVNVRSLGKAMFRRD